MQTEDSERGRNMKGAIPKPDPFLRRVCHGLNPRSSLAMSVGGFLLEVAPLGALGTAGSPQEGC